MKLTFPKRKLRSRSWWFVLPATAFVVFLVRPVTVLAGPLTGGSGVTPFTKVGVYQGLLTILPDGSGSIMELGNSGQDIASSGSIYWRPGTLGANNVVSSGSAHDEMVFSKFFRDANVANKTSVSLPGQLCIGSIDIPPDTSHCKKDLAAAFAGGSTLDQILAAGNGSNIAIVLGQGGGSGVKNSSALIDITGGGGGQIGHGVSSRIVSSSVSPSTLGAIYAKNSTGNWAGQFAGGQLNGNFSVIKVNNVSSQLCLNTNCITGFPYLTAYSDSLNESKDDHIPMYETHGSNQPDLRDSGVYYTSQPPGFIPALYDAPGGNVGLGTLTPHAKLDAANPPYSISTNKASVVYVNPSNSAGGASHALTLGDSDTGIRSIKDNWSDWSMYTFWLNNDDSLVQIDNYALAINNANSGSVSIDTWAASTSTGLNIGKYNPTYPVPTLLAYNSDPTHTQHNTITAHRSGTNVSGSAVYGTLHTEYNNGVGPYTCWSVDHCAGIEGSSQGSNGTAGQLWAGYFAGDVFAANQHNPNIPNGPSLVYERIYLKNDPKNTFTMHVYGVGSNTLSDLGTYQFSSGSTPDRDISTEIKYNFQKSNRSIGAQPIFDGVSCSSGSDTLVAADTNFGDSYYTDATCGASGGQEYTLSSPNWGFGGIYRAESQHLCKGPGVPGPLSFLSHRNYVSGNCLLSGPPVNQYTAYPVHLPNYAPAFELR